MDPDNDARPGQLTQLYFWGGHGGIGGGDVRQTTCSDCTLRFCVDEMLKRKLPLKINMNMIPEYGDVYEPGQTIVSSRVMSFVERFTGKYVRPIEAIEYVHPTAIRRYQRCPDWRPAALENLHDAIMAITLEDE